MKTKTDLTLLLFAEAPFPCQQEATWTPLKTFFDAKADEATKKRLRSLPQKKAWLVKRGFKLQKDLGL